MNKFITGLLLVILGGCSGRDVATTLPRKEVENLLTTPIMAPYEPPIPHSVILEVPSLDPELQKRVSVRIEESADLRDVLIQLCKQAKINVILDKDIEGSLYYQATSRPFLEIITNICEISNLRFTFENHLLRVERDLPYLKTYSIQFLNLSRKTKNSVSINTNIFAKTMVVDANGSSSTISSETDIDFWSELEKSIENILNLSRDRRLKEEDDKVIEEKKITPLSKHLSREISEHPKAKTEENRKVITKQRTSFAIHRQAGLMSIYATEKQHKNIDFFLKRLKKQTSTQILIEAKVVEVTLKEEYRSGIDWQRIGRYGLGAYGADKTSFTGDFEGSALFGTLAQKTSSLITTPETDRVISLGVRGNSLSAILNFMESFGTVRTLSSPRLTVLNNQTALLKVAENFVFFTVTGDRQFLNADATNYGSVVSVSSTPQSIPIGLVMNVQPAIDESTQEIILNLRPTISRLIDVKQDPAVEILNQSLTLPSKRIRSDYPVVAVREIDSILRIKSGNMAILGGLMVEGAESGTAGIPGTSESFFSFFTSAKHQHRVVTELVIFLKATILEDPTPHGADKRVYEKFTMDPRPLQTEMNW
jgi:general secretion pathway protein D